MKQIVRQVDDVTEHTSKLAKSFIKCKELESPWYLVIRLMVYFW